MVVLRRYINLCADWSEGCACPTESRHVAVCQLHHLSDGCYPSFGPRHTFFLCWPRPAWPAKSYRHRPQTIPFGSPRHQFRLLAAMLQSLDQGSVPVVFVGFGLVQSFYLQQMDGLSAAAIGQTWIFDRACTESLIWQMQFVECQGGLILRQSTVEKVSIEWEL